MDKISKIEVRNAIFPDDGESIKALWLEYLVWGNDKMQAMYGVHPHNPTETVKDDLKNIAKFQPPQGRLMLALYENKICGLGSLKSITTEIGEIKRMYVDPTFRGIGAGRAILHALLEEAKAIGYTTVRLDTPKFMVAAHALYRSFGFYDIGPYPEMEVSQEFKEYLLFMEIDLLKTIDLPN